MQGWPGQISPPLRPHHSKMEELSVEAGCLMWGRRVIPQSSKEEILMELHKEHIGTSKMKALARSHVWWAGIAKDMVVMVKSCKACLAVKQDHSYCTHAPVGVAKLTLETSAYRFCRSIHGQVFPNRCGCMFQVGWYYREDFLHWSYCSGKTDENGTWKRSVSKHSPVYIFSAKLLSTPLTSLSIKQTMLQAVRNYLLTWLWCDARGVAHKSWYLSGAESFAFSQLLAWN